MSDSTFYIGRSVDLLASSQSAPAAAQTVRYDPDDLTTHGIIVGMTGSGKTGLLINLLEEAALRGLPSIVIDPKGDLTNLLLHFPDLLPSDFEPWIDPETARRQKLTVPELAEATSARGPAKLGPRPRRAGRPAAGGRLRRFHPRLIRRAAGELAFLIRPAARAHLG
jgi:DNA helicase HerA-like ATPase